MENNQNFNNGLGGQPNNMNNNSGFNQPNMNNQQAQPNMYGQQAQPMYNQQVQNNNQNQPMYNQQTQPNMNNQPMYNQPMYNQQMNNYGQPQQNMYTTPMQAHTNAAKPFAKVIMIIAAIMLGFVVLIGGIVAIVIGAATKEKPEISSSDVRSYLKDNDIDYDTYDDYGILYGDTKVYETDDLYITITSCDDESEAKKEYKEEMEFLDDMYDFNLTTNVDGTNFDKATRQDTSSDVGYHIIRVEDKVLMIISIDDYGYEIAKEIFDELGY